MAINGTRFSIANNTVIKHKVTWLHCLMIIILIVHIAVINQIPLVVKQGQIPIQAIPAWLPSLKPWYWSYFQWPFKVSGVLNKWLLHPVSEIMDITASLQSHDQNLVTWQPTYNHRGTSTPPTCLSLSDLCSFDCPTFYWLSWPCAPFALLPYHPEIHLPCTQSYTCPVVLASTQAAVMWSSHPAALCFNGPATLGSTCPAALCSTPAVS